MSRIMLLVLIVAFIQKFFVEGQSTLGSNEASGLNSVTELQSSILEELREIQNRLPVCSNECAAADDKLGQHLNNITKSLQILGDQLEALDQNVQRNRHLFEFLLLKVNSSQMTQTLDIVHLNNRLDALDRNFQSGRESCESLQLKVNSSQMTQTLGIAHLNNRLEALDRNVQSGRESCESLQLKVNSSKIENLLERNDNNMRQTFHSLNNSIEALNQDVQNGRVLNQNLQLKLQNLSTLYEEQVTFLRSVDQKLEEHDPYSRNQSSNSTSDHQDCHTTSRDCTDIRNVYQARSNVYRIYYHGSDLSPVEMSVYCELNSSNTGWLVFQIRKDGSENFERAWIEYEDGFGDLRGEFWLGNKALHRLTSSRNYKLRIELEDFEGQKRYAEYSQFVVGPASDNYRLNISGYSGNAGDDMAFHNSRMFSTKDADHDGGGVDHCAQKYRGAWWYNDCHSSNLNGLYLRGNHTSIADGIEWGSFRGFQYSLKYVEMKIAPRN